VIKPFITLTHFNGVKITINVNNIDYFNDTQLFISGNQIWVMESYEVIFKLVEEALKMSDEEKAIYIKILEARIKSIEHNAMPPIIQRP
jgi:uncharacterized protein YlzI (FlbEa/FlbD family)